MRFLFQLKIILQNDIFETVKLSIENGMKRNGSKISRIRFDINSSTIKYTIDVAVKYLTTRYISMRRVFHKFISKSVLSLHRILAMFRLRAQALSSS